LTPQFPRLFVWHVARYARRHKLLAALNVFSVALGVAVYLAIQIANHSANESFAASVDLVAGKANLEVRSPGGGFDEALYPKLAHAPGVRAATPLVEGYLTLPDYPGEYLQVLGLDLFTNPPFSTFTIADQRQNRIDIEHWLSDPGALALSEEFARLYHLRVGDPLKVQINGRNRTLTVRFLISLKDSPAGANSRVAALDIGWAQELFQKRGQLSSIQLLLDDPARADATAAELKKLVPADVNVAAPSQRSNQVQRMVASFQLNLSALSLVSLLVGMFLIYNTISASVVRRRVEIGILRAVGATRLEIHCLFLGEALLFGLLGVALGLAGGVALATVLVGKVAQTISSLYLLVSIQRFYLTPLIVGSGIFFGLGSVLAAAWFPAREGARIDPVRALNLGAVRDEAVRTAPRWFWLGMLALLLAVACSALALTAGPKWLGFASAFFVLLGFALLAPLVTRFAAAGVENALRIREDRATSRALDFPAAVWLRLASQNLVRSAHRNAATVAALMAAIAMTVGISVMIFAFRRTVETWIDQAIVADVFITPAANETLGNGAFMPPEAVAALEHHPDVAAIDTFREVGVTIRGERISMGAVRGQNRNRLNFLGGNNAEKQARFYAPDTVLVTESFARRFHVKDGDKLPIPTPGGIVDFTIGGVYYDYTRDQGVILMARENFDRYWRDPRVQSVALYLKDPAKIDAVAGEFRARFNQGGEFLIYSNRSLRERIFEIFAQTFSVTYVLRVIAVIVAMVGIFLTLTTLVSERERDIGVLRAIGASRGQIQAAMLAESGMIGLLAGLLGVAAGLSLSLVLTFVINKAFFGWTIQLSFPWLSILMTPLWIVLASLAAGWLPALRAARVPIAAAVRSE
jgi:putative ABC transport system permease protein